MKDDLFNYLVATDSLDEFLGYEEKKESGKGRSLSFIRDISLPPFPFLLIVLQGT